MKKIQAIFFIICFVVPLLVIGCGGSNDNEVGPAPVSSVFIMAVTASGDNSSGNAAFSLSIKESHSSSIFPDVSVSENKIKLKVQPLKDGTEIGNPILVDTASLTVANNTISANVAVEATSNQYSVEVIAAGNESNPLIKSIVATAQAPKNGEILAAVVNASSTAFSMAYVQWLSQGPSDKSYSTFIYNVSTSLLDIASISLLIQDNLNKAAKSGAITSYSPLTDSDVKTQVANFANGVKKEAPVTPINASDIVGTWEVVKKSESQGNVDKILRTKPNPSGKYETFIFTSDASFTQTEYAQVFNSSTDEIVFSDQISATSQGNWTVQGNTLSLAFSKKLKDYTVSFSSDGYLKFYPTSTANGVVLFLRKTGGNAKSLSDIALNPASIAMNPDGTYNLSQVVVTAVYSDSSTQLVTAGTWSKASGNGTVTGTEYKAPSTTGSDVLSCSYTEGGVTKTANLTVSLVRETILSNLSLSTGNISVGVGVTFDLTPIGVTAVYSDNTKKTITTVAWSKKTGNGAVSGLTYTSPSAPGNDVLTCAYTENGVTRTIDLIVTVTQTKVLSSIILAPSAISLNANTSYSLSQISVTALFSDGTSKTVADVSWGKKSANGSLSGTTYLAPPASGTDVLTCTYTENGNSKTADLSITINSSTSANPAQTLSSLNLSSTSIAVNTNGTYNLGQLTVTANYSNSTNQTVLTPMWSVKSGGGSVNGSTFSAPASPGTVYLTCPYTENGVTKTVDLTVTVSATKTLSNISFSVASISLFVNASYDLSQVSVTANYSDNTSQPVTNVAWSIKTGVGNISGNTFTAPATSGTSIIESSYTENGITKTFDFTVIVIPAIPSIPVDVVASFSSKQSSITWSVVSQATSYNLYWSTTAGVTKTNGTKVSNVSSPYNHTGLTNGTPYYYVLTSVNSSGESSESLQVSVTPQPPPLAPNEIDLGDEVRMKFAEIPSGTFQMGQVSIAEPVHQITLTKSFFMSSYEITQTQYQKIVGVNPSYFHPGQTGYSSGYPDTSSLPVEQVSWFDCIRYCNSLSLNQGLTPCYRNQINSTTVIDTDTITCDWSASGYRLPTEAEWEFACRAKTTSSYYWGEDSSEATVKQYCWYALNCYLVLWTNPHAEKGGTQPVGQKLPNAFGLYDIGGNVWEWCHDWYTTYASGNQTDPKGPTTGSWRVLRGGGWGNYYISVSDFRSASRLANTATTKHDSYGFRVVRLKP